MASLLLRSFPAVLRLTIAVPQKLAASQFHSSVICLKGWADFKDPVVKDEVMITGRAWTNADLRRKDFSDLHKLWYVLYKERNVLLTMRNKARTAQRPISDVDECRYINVKRSMAAIKHTLDERKKIRTLINREEKEAAEKLEAEKAVQSDNASV